jgi:asparagine synthase (glutamine-hydrolysing)
MCGIAGAIAVTGEGLTVDVTVVARMNQHQRRRGPDGVGLWQSPERDVALGHRRLAIIDVGADGAQPMSDATGRFIVSFNGEIYNYRELRGELECLGHRFVTRSDTEVLINTLAQWGEAGLPRLRGMYAFALWDTQERELFIARDPYGIKPLYVAECEGVLWFASQARALAACAPVDTRRDPAGLTGFYLWGHVPEPFTWYAGIRMLPAGHLMRVRAGRPSPAAHAFVRIEDAFTRQPAAPIGDVRLRELMLDSVGHHLVADVPVGLFLSAGVDSNVVAALATEHGARLQTVTLAFDEYRGTPHDEAPCAENVARMLGTDHTTVRIGREEFVSILDDFFDAMDQPTIDGLNTYLVSRAAAGQGLKVALSGLGGDELFAGYPSFRQVPLLVKCGRRVPARRRLGRFLQPFLSACARLGMPPKLAGTLEHMDDYASAYLLRRSLHLEHEIDDLIDESFWRDGLAQLATIPALRSTIAPLESAQVSPSCQIAAMEACWYMRNQLLRDTDWSSMAFGMEVRVPLVDYHLLLALAPAVASDAPPTKRSLAVCAPTLPRGMVEQPKRGFTTPVSRWIATGSSGKSGRLRAWSGFVHRRMRGGASAMASNR